MHLGSHCPPGYFGMPPESCKEMSSLSPCPFWTKPITHVGLPYMTTVRKCVCVPIHMQLCSTGFPGAFRVTAFQARLTTLMVSRRDGACASLRHLEERNFTSTSPKLSRSTVSTSHPRPIGRFERTDRSFPRVHSSPVLHGQDVTPGEYYDRMPPSVQMVLLPTWRIVPRMTRSASPFRYCLHLRASGDSLRSWPRRYSPLPLTSLRRVPVFSLVHSAM